MAGLGVRYVEDVAVSVSEALRAGIDRNRLAWELTDLSDGVSRAIGSVRWMDPPDGGSVTLAEQVARMREHIEELEGGR